MSIPIPTRLVEFILLGPMDDRRQLQDSPILGDVWVEFGRKPAKALDLLISPFRTLHAGSVASDIDDGLGEKDDQANIAFLQGLIVAALTFEQVLRVVVPKTAWWVGKWPKVDDANVKVTSGHELELYTPDKVHSVLTDVLRLAELWHTKEDDKEAPKEDDKEAPKSPLPLDRFVALTGLIHWAGSYDGLEKSSAETDKQITSVLKAAQAEVEPMSVKLVGLINGMLADPQRKPRVWQISLNRSAMPALTKSVAAVKADAAKTLFKVDCRDIAWAVIDSGIDGRHPAFKDSEGKSRIQRSFDFKNFRNIVSLSNAKEPGKIRGQNVELLLKHKEFLKNPPTEAEADADLKKLAQDAKNRGPVRWEIVEKFVEIRPETEPPTTHGTHVAGIIGASKEAATKEYGKPNEDFADGMCPEIALFDFRVLAPSVKETEFAIVAALQFIRYLNDRDNFHVIHGANLSLSIPHDVRNFACGRTPICNECERLVESGVVVVAAAGNHGYKSFETKEGSFDSYAAFSITDPGNADGVITVGATHRFWPHTYGVSFFSSRGPTGDGRIKPDLVAPGERIHATMINGAWGDLDGTSMAAPHVSGAAAMLMARYSELIGQPRRLKSILLKSATDLGRERSFQGNGMLDVLRAFQSI